MDFNYPFPFPHNKENKKKRGSRERKRGRVVLYPTSKEIKKNKEKCLFDGGRGVGRLCSELVHLKDLTNIFCHIDERIKNSTHLYLLSQLRQGQKVALRDKK